MSDNDILSRAAEIGNQRGETILVELDRLAILLEQANKGPDGQVEFKVFTGTSVTVRTSALPASLGRIKRFPRDIHQRAELRVGHKNDTSSAPAIATIRPATRDVLFTSKTYAAVTAGTAANYDLSLVDKHVSSKNPRPLSDSRENAGAFLIET
jgi:hypothetical protein